MTVSMVHDEAFQATLSLRIIAVFVVLAASLLGVLPPFLLRGTSSPMFRVFKALSSGVMLSLGVVHLLPEAAADFQVLGFAYGPMAEAIAVGGFFLMLVVDQTVLAFFPPDGASSVCGHKHGSYDLPVISPASDASSDDEASSDSGATVKKRVSAFLMELGCGLHSVLIGMGLGVIVENRREVIVMMIALSFHQMLEGVGLAAVVKAAKMSRIQSVALVLSYALTTSFGIALGILLSSTGYDSYGQTAKTVQGTLNGLAAGMIIYIAVVNLIVEDFTRKDLQTMPRTRFWMHVALAAGLISMCVIAYWA